MGVAEKIDNLAAKRTDAQIDALEAAETNRFMKPSMNLGNFK